MDAGLRREKFMQVIDQVVPFMGCSVLEIGCGRGDRSPQIARRCRLLTGIDPDREAVRIATGRKITNASFEIGRAEDLRFSAERFDVVVFTSSFHHVPIPLMARAIEEAVDTCKRGGYIIFYEPKMHGSFYEAEVRFGACDGDEREAKRAAQEAIHNHPRLQVLEELADETMYRFRSISDFVRATHPHKNLSDVGPFLQEYGGILLAPRTITICRPD